MPSLRPASSGGFIIEVKTAASPHAAIVSAEALKWRLRTPCKRTLLVGEAGQPLQYLINRKWRLFHRIPGVEFAGQGRGGQPSGMRIVRIEGGLTYGNNWGVELL